MNIEGKQINTNKDEMGLNSEKKVILYTAADGKVTADVFLL